MTTAELATRAIADLRASDPGARAASMSWAMDELRRYVTEANAIDATDRIATELAR